MDFINLRKLTMKSKLGFGPYGKETIERIIAAQKFRHLRHIYYTYANIDFTDDVKAAINLTRPIPKPGISPETEALLNEEMDKRMVGDTKLKFQAMRKAQKKREDISKRKNSRENLTRAELQAFNHGHIYITTKSL